jgi:hypothetical protein
VTLELLALLGKRIAFVGVPYLGIGWDRNSRKISLISFWIFDGKQKAWAKFLERLSALDLSKYPQMCPFPPPIGTLITPWPPKDPRDHWRKRRYTWGALKRGYALRCSTRRVVIIGIGSC